MTIKIYNVESTPARLFHCLSPTLCSILGSFNILPAIQTETESKFIMDTELAHTLSNLSKERILYQCGSPNLAQSFTSQGYGMLGHYIHNNGKTICIYKLCPEMVKFLEEWTKNKPKRVDN